jgi:hypothetical protein
MDLKSLMQHFVAETVADFPAANHWKSGICSLAEGQYQ